MAEGGLNNVEKDIKGLRMRRPTGARGVFIILDDPYPADATEMLPVKEDGTPLFSMMVTPPEDIHAAVAREEDR